MNKTIRKHLGAYLNRKAKQGHNLSPGASLFMSRNSNMISKRATERIVEKWINRAGLEGYTCHSLRHTFAMKLRRRGVGLERIQKLFPWLPPAYTLSQVERT